MRAYLAGKLAELDTNHKEFMTLATEADDAYLAGNLKAGDAFLKKQIPLQERLIELLEDPLLAFFTDLDEWLPTEKADLKMMKAELGGQ